MEAMLPLLDASAAAPLRATPPRYAHVDVYRYEMAAPLWVLAARFCAAPHEPLVWWTRRFEEGLLPVVTVGESGKLERADPSIRDPAPLGLYGHGRSETAHGRL